MTFHRKIWTLTRILAEVTAMFEEEKKRLKDFLAEDEAILKE